MEQSQVLHILGLNCRSDQEEKLNRWYDERHIPDLLKSERLRKVSRYEALYPGKIDPGYPDLKYPAYVSIYEFADQQAYEEYEAGPELAAGHENVREVWSKDPFERVWRVQYRLLKTYEK